MSRFKSEIKRSLFPREEPPINHFEEHGGESWAVSYADLLMVVMSFFIVFFSFEDKTAKNVVEEIAVGMKNKIGAQSAAAHGGRSVASASNPVLQNLQALLTTGKLTPTLADRVLFVRLPDELYGPGQFAANDHVRHELDRVFEIIKPFMKEISLTIVGHSDSQRVMNRTRFVQDNFALSSLRAAHALRLAQEFGFSADQLFATGSAENERNSRTLSLKIQPREVAP